YAVGVVGAIAVNLGSTATDFKLTLKRWERGLMFGTFLVLAAIELTLFVTKPQARVFAATVLAAGLVLRGIAREWEQKRNPVMARPHVEPRASSESKDFNPTGAEPMLCAVRGIG